MSMTSKRSWRETPATVLLIAASAVLLSSCSFTQGTGSNATPVDQTVGSAGNTETGTLSGTGDETNPVIKALNTAQRVTAERVFASNAQAVLREVEAGAAFDGGVAAQTDFDSSLRSVAANSSDMTEVSASLIGDVVTLNATIHEHACTISIRTTTYEVIEASRCETRSGA